MCFPLHSGLQYSSTCISRDSEKRPKYDEFIFESFCMEDRNYIAGTGIQGNKVWLMHYNAWLYIHIGNITYIWKNILNQTINF